jgi:alkyldihydroxyacetonephosphate synthase
MIVAIDRVSLLADVDAKATLAQCEAELRKQELTLDVDMRDRDHVTIGAWLAEGAPGARDPWMDPVDHLVAGLEATLEDGRALSFRPAPRRAVGPDLIALVVGMKGRYATVTRAWLRVHPVGVARPTTHPLAADRNPEVTEGEAALLTAIEAALDAR